MHVKCFSIFYVLHITCLIAVYDLVLRQPAKNGINVKLVTYNNLLQCNNRMTEIKYKTYNYSVTLSFTLYNNLVSESNSPKDVGITTKEELIVDKKKVTHHPAEEGNRSMT